MLVVCFLGRGLAIVRNVSVEGGFWFKLVFRKTKIGIAGDFESDLGKIEGVSQVQTVMVREQAV